MSSDQTLQSLIDKLFLQIDQVENGTNDLSDAPKSAALALKVEFHLINFVIPDLELKSKKSKNEIKYAETDAWIRIKAKKGDDGGRVTDASAKQLIPSDISVKQAENDNIEAEVEYRKVYSLLSTIKDAHLMFRGLSRQ